VTWKQVTQPCRCTLCGNFVATTWRYFPEPALWTLAYCEPCTAELLDTPAA